MGDRTWIEYCQTREQGWAGKMGEIDLQPQGRGNRSQPFALSCFYDCVVATAACSLPSHMLNLMVTEYHVNSILPVPHHGVPLQSLPCGVQTHGPLPLPGVIPHKDGAHRLLPPTEGSIPSRRGGKRLMRHNLTPMTRV